ncbi:peroxiredoxin [Sphingomonas bacterium]|uniref:peroxiredoxin n=1 Tax=Sphingomonas bacterium TaxID=1895847 RepID=UPI001C2D5BFE|nr:peroxiredoxin [Sphingomonas bacterium]
MVDELPELILTATDGSPLPLASLRGRPAVVYFYPKDDTSGCTKEAQDFSLLAADFTAAGVRVIGVSKDTPASHQRFTGKHQLEVQLVSDESGAACEAFGAWIEKSMYGKKYMGIDRSTFLFDAAGRLARVWRKVKVPGHAGEVLSAARAL